MPPRVRVAAALEQRNRQTPLPAPASLSTADDAHRRVGAPTTTADCRHALLPEVNRSALSAGCQLAGIRSRSHAVARYLPSSLPPCPRDDPSLNAPAISKAGAFFHYRCKRQI